MHMKTIFLLEWTEELLHIPLYIVIHCQCLLFPLLDIVPGHIQMNI